MVKMLFSDREILPSLYDKQRSANPCVAGGGLLASSSSLLRRRTSREGVQGGEQGGEQGGSRGSAWAGAEAGALHNSWPPQGGSRCTRNDLALH